MNDILAQVEKAARDYKAVSGKWPKTIGIHYKYPGSLPPSIIVREWSPSPPVLAVKEHPDKPLECVPYTQHLISLEPIAGPGIKLDEVYITVPAGPWQPESQRQVIGSKLLARMAREFVV